MFKDALQVPRAWSKRRGGGEYLRTESAMADTPEAEDGLMRSGWEPLYDRATLDAAVAAERERCSEHAQKLRIGFERYETARRMNPSQWADAWELSSTGKGFDEIVDDLRPFLRA